MSEAINGIDTGCFKIFNTSNLQAIITLHIDLTMTVKNAQKYLRSLSNASIAEHSQRYFKTGIGDYGHGDNFLGIRVPTLRAETKRFINISIDEVEALLKSDFHEERLFALLILVARYGRADVEGKTVLYDFYMKNTEYINNWDLVDTSAYKLVGEHLLDKSRKPLYKLARSKNMWERRISIISTLQFIKQKDFSDTLKISEILLQDTEDLIHKAVGWMLREVGNRDRRLEEEFLKIHCRSMPRVMLRYAVEKFSAEERDLYMRGYA